MLYFGLGAQPDQPPRRWSNHGLSYLIKRSLHGPTSKVSGFQEEQVAYDTHANVLMLAMWCFLPNPQHAEVYNLSDGRRSDSSIP